MEREVLEEEVKCNGRRPLLASLHLLLFTCFSSPAYLHLHLSPASHPLLLIICFSSSAFPHLLFLTCYPKASLLPNMARWRESLRGNYHILAVLVRDLILLNRRRSVIKVFLRVLR